MAAPEISIVTPSFNMLPSLKLCWASIRDQGVEVEHVVIDGGSSDGTVEWLRVNPEIISQSEKDRGMYHALNKAISRSTAPIIGHLNCDEQYLPGVLKFVMRFFQDHPETDFVAADFLIVNPEGEFLAYRKSFHPRWQYFFSNYLYTTTCTLFYRRKVFEACQFDESYRSIADVIFLYRVLKSGFSGLHVRKYFAAFVYSGKNLSLNPISREEKKRFHSSLPGWYRMARPFFFLLFYVERVLHGTYREAGPLVYEIFTKPESSKRVAMRVEKPGFRLKFVAR